jgi:hypothetical protein
MDADAPPALAATLETGRIEVRCAGDPARAAALFGFAERINPKRAFLFVSKVLGRHIPVAPSVMRAAFAALAQGIPDDLPGPVVVTGMAETAVGLGAGVHDAYVARTGRADALFLSTTRTRFGGPLLGRFDEVHSHASGHLVHLPVHARDRALAAGARSLVMVDDEASTGQTFRNLAGVLLAGGPGRGLPALERIRCCVLTDWSGGAEGGALIGPDGRAIAVETTALLTGAFRWTARAGAPIRALPDADVERARAIMPIARDDDGRLGRAARSAATLPAGLAEAMAPVVGKIHVLGAGEHVWEPFLIAEGLERLGHDVSFSATTRSPILAGGAVRAGMAFRDHEGLGIANYLYNVDPGAYARIVLCVDTGIDAVDPALLRSLRADLVVGVRFHDRAEVARRIGPGPAARVIGPAASGTGPAASGTGPAASGTGPAAHGTGPAVHGIDHAASGNDPAAHEIDPAARKSGGAP